MNYKYIIPYVMCLLFAIQITYTQDLKEATKKIDSYHKTLTSKLQTQDSKGLLEEDVANWVITSEHVSSTSGVHHIYYRQAINNIEIYGAEASIHIMSNGEILSKNNNFIANVSKKVKGSKSPSLTPLQAVSTAANNANYRILENLKILDVVDFTRQEYIISKGGISNSDIPVKLMYIQKRNGDVVLTWSLAIDDIEGRNYYNFKVDAQTGEIIDKIDWQSQCGLEHDHNHVHDDHHSSNNASKEYNEVVTMEESLEEYYSLLGGSYRVYAMPVESPNHGTRTLVTGVEDLNASPFGWHDTNGSPGVEYTNTRGNNVRAYDDINGSNGPGTYGEGGASLAFDFPVNTTWSTANRSLPAAITNLFYWSNIVHDVVYQYGFDEASGNFQQNNYGNGGNGGDYVRAEAQDGGGSCNANFATPNDGSLPRMQMYVCDSRDGDLDNGVIIHEYGHGISTRLTGGRFNSGCLNTNNTPEQMGEGWSDYYALLLTMKPGDLGPNARPIGTWLVGQTANEPGIREFPYSTNMAVNSHTYVRTQTAIAPHGVGSVWAMMLWEMTWGLIDQYGFDTDFYNGTGGNNISLALVTEGLKLQPCSPGFVNGRDAILAADMALYGGANQCIIWSAFAKRGLGFSASQGSSGTNADNIQAFDLPPTSFVASESFCVTEGIQSGLTGGTPGGGAYSGTGVTDDGNGNTYTFDPNDAGVGNHTVTYTSICGGTANIIINVTEAPDAPSVTNDTFCSGDNVTLTATPNDPGNQIEWYTAATDGTLLFTGPSYTFAPAGTTSVYAEEVLSASPTPATITHSNSQNIGTGSVYCQQGSTGTHAATSHWRVFDLSNDFGVTGEFNVNQIQFGLQSVNNNYTLTVRLHTLTGTFNTSNLTLLGTINVPVSPATNGTVVSAPFSTTVPAGSILVMEIFTPANGSTRFLPGSNGSGQSGPSYFSSGNCGMNQPTDLSSIGYPNTHYVMSISGEYSVASLCTGSRAEAIAQADNTPPLAIAQDFTVFLDVNGQATISSTNINNGSSDNCAIDSMSVSPDFFNCSAIGDQTVTLTVTDTEGNIGSAQATVSVIDNLVPNIGTASNQTISGNASCQATLADYTSLVSAADNCGTPTITQSPVPGTLITGTTTVTLTATDASGNFASSSFDVIIEDTTNPIIQTIADQTAAGDASCQATLADFTALAVVSDNCDSSPVVSQSPTAGTTFSGTTTVTLTVTDASGNDSSTSFDVNVDDTTDPTIQTIADQTAAGDASCQATLADFTALAVVSDNCDSSPTVSQLPTPGTVFSETTSVTLTVTDASGNDSWTSFDVNVEDTTDPTIQTIADQTAAGDSSCQATLADFTALAVVSDNCDSSPVVSQIPAAGTIFSGTTSVTLIVTDASGNDAYTSFNVNLEDTTDPTIQIIADQTASGDFECRGTVADYTSLAVVADNCDAAPAVTQSPSAGTTFSGTTYVTLTVTDASGNDASTSFDVSVEDTTDPTIDTIADQTVSGDASCDGTVADYTSLGVVADNCDTAPAVTQSPAAGTTFSGSVLITLTVTDASGNDASTSFDVSVEDTTAPSIDAIADQTVSGDASCDGTVADYTNLAVVVDNCDAAPAVTQSPAVGTTFSGSVLVTLTVTDASGNDASTSFDVSVEDTTAPSIDAIADQTVSGDASCEGTVADYTSLAVVADNCDVAPAVTQVPAAGTTFSGTTTVTLTVTDASGNDSSTSFDVNVEDTTDPTIDAIADQTVSGDASCEGTVADYTSLAVVADNCDAAPAVTQSPTAGTTFSGTTSVTLTVTDASGNDSSASFDVNVEDTTDPTIDAIADQTVSGDASCEGSVADYTSLAVVADNCDAAPAVTQSPSAGTTFSGTTYVTLTVTDASGNDASTSFDVSVKDTTAPSIDSIADQTVSGDASCEGTVADYTGFAVVADNCDAAPAVTQSPAEGTTFSGSVLVTLTVTDASGNDASTSFDVSVEDNTAPSIDAIADQTVSGDASCEGTVADYTGLAVVADNCDAAPAVTQSPSAGTTFSETTSVTLTVTDAAGNDATTSFDVSVEDTTDPTIDTIADQTVSGDASCEGTVADYTGLAVVADNCDAAPAVTQSPVAGTTFSGTTSVTLTVTDASGNESSTSFDVSVEDTTDPTIDAVANQTVSGDASCEGTLSDYTFLAVVADNCDAAPAVTQSPAEGTTFSGTTSVTLIVTDASGNESSTSFDVTVEDTTDPTIDAIADQTVSGDASCEGTVADYTGLALVNDNCDIAPAVTQVPAAGTTFSGTTSVALTVIDASGNDASTSFDVTVEDTTDPTIDTIADQTISGDASCEGTVADYTSLAVVADNCDAAPAVTQSPSAGTTFSGTTSVTLTVTDASGNDSSTFFAVNVEDTTDPTIATIADQTVSGDASCEGTVADYTSLAVVADNCDAAPAVTQSPTAGTTFSGSVLVTLTVTDASGNDASTSFDVIVEDTTDPTIDTIADQTVSGDASCEGTVADYTGLAVVADNCDAAPAVTQSPAVGTTFSGSVLVTLTVTDASGNDATTSFDVVLEDTTDPTIDTIADQAVSGDASCEGTVADYIGLAVVADNCDAAPVVTQSPAPGTTFSGTTSVTLTVTDASGNDSSTSFDVSVEDTTDPTIDAVADQTVFGDASCEGTVADYTGFAVVVDNCDAAPAVTQSPAAGTTFSGTTSVTLTVTDASGNESSTSFDVSVEDTTDPTIDAVADQTVSGDASCEGTLSDYTFLAVVADNCDAAPVVTQSPAAGTTFSGTTSVTLTVTDASGNESSTSFDVSVEDTTDPTIDAVADQTVSGDASCEGTLSDYTFLAVVADNCDAAPAVTQSPSAGTTFSGTTSVTLTVTDASGNESSTSFDVSVEDTTDPTIDVVADQTVSGDASCEGTVSDYTGLAVVADNCDAAPAVTQSPAAGTTFSGTTSVTLTVTDASGNESSTSFDVTVEDMTAPLLEDIDNRIIASNNNCEASLPDYSSLAIVTDNCDLAPVISQSPAIGTVFAGTIEVTITATDASGNNSSTSFNVTVIDTIDPVIECPEDMLVTPDEDGTYILADLTSEAIAFDNCTLSPSIVQVPAPGSIFTEGSVNTITLIATDDAGNTSECSFLIEVDENLSDDASHIYGNDIILYPSPATDFFMIQNKGNIALSKLDIFDIRGRLVSSHSINSEGNNLQFDISKLAGGVYWITIFSENGKIIKRLIID